MKTAARQSMDRTSQQKNAARQSRIAPVKRKIVVQ
jgi:hypothetical protein